MDIILISGKQGSGKSTLSDAIHYNLWNAEPFFQLTGCPHRLRFAQPLYEMHDACREVAKKYNIPFPEPKDGELLQMLGTEWGRRLRGENVWVQAMLTKIRSLPKDAQVVIDDCRFENEFDAFHMVPGCIRVRLECARAIRKGRASYWRENDQHLSEVGLDHYAASGRFDLYFDTEKTSTDEIMSAIVEFKRQHSLKGKSNEAQA